MFSSWLVVIQWNVWWETAPWDHRKWSYMTGGLSLEVQMYRNVGPCYCNSSFFIGGWSLITVASHYRFHHTIKLCNINSDAIFLFCHWVNILLGIVCHLNFINKKIVMSSLTLDSILIVTIRFKHFMTTLNCANGDFIYNTYIPCMYKHWSLGMNGRTY